MEIWISWFRKWAKSATKLCCNNQLRKPLKGYWLIIRCCWYLMSCHFMFPPIRYRKHLMQNTRHQTQPHQHQSQVSQCNRICERHAFHTKTERERGWVVFKWVRNISTISTQFITCRAKTNNFCTFTALSISHTLNLLLFISENIYKVFEHLMSLH